MFLPIFRDIYNLLNGVYRLLPFGEAVLVWVQTPTVFNFLGKPFQDQMFVSQDKNFWGKPKKCY